MNYVDTNSKAYHIALESFTDMSFDQPNRDKMNYRKAAMESITSPDSGMVLDRLYKNVMSRSSINFGKIPESMGDLTKFARYKTIADTLTLLNRQMAEYDIYEIKLAQELHDTIIRCREDFMYGFKVDSQYLKTTYNTMVYSLCELLSLCDVIYVDMLKASAEGRQPQATSYKDLILVQNVQKFIDIYKSGDWTATVTTIRKDARNLINFVYNDNGGNGSPMSSIAKIVGTVGVPGVAIAALTPGAKAAAAARGATNSIPNLGDYISHAKGVGKAIWAKPSGKIGVAIVGIVAVLLLVRGLVFTYFRGMYKLNDMLDDQEKFLKAHIENYAESGNTKALDRQMWLYNKLVGLQTVVRGKILKADGEGRKMLKESNAKDFSAEAFQADAAGNAPANTGDDDFSIN